MGGSPVKKLLVCVALALLAATSYAGTESGTYANMGTCLDGSPREYFIVDATSATSCAAGGSGFEAHCCCKDGAWAVCATAGGTSNSFETINAPSGTDPVASTATDTLNLTAAGGITITGNSGTDTLAFDFASTSFLPAVSAPAVDAANAVWGISTGLVFEGATADGFETTITSADPTVDANLRIPAPLADGNFFYSTLTTNREGNANSVWGESNSLAFEGATVNAFETRLEPTDPTADRTLALPDASGTLGVREPSLNTWPVSASSYDDEFTSTTLDGKWTKGVTSGNTTTAGSIGLLNSPAAPVYDLTTVPGWLMWQSDSASSGVTFTQAWTQDTTSMFFMRCQQDQRFLNSSQEASVHFGPTVAADANESVFMWAYNSGAVLVFRIQVQNNGAFTESAATGISESHPISPYIMLLVRNGNSYYGFVSFNEGAAFTYLGTVTKTGVTTFDEVRIVFLGANETPSPIMGCDYFRYETDFDYPTFTR